ncbi:MAG: hypothetical protein KAS32_24285, partial [Candidatus Peribacteraceae bacterium]|nr:hypothetical protein [Candidatus Peribacteraceae bacterium]
MANDKKQDKVHRKTIDKLERKIKKNLSMGEDFKRKWNELASADYAMYTTGGWTQDEEDYLIAAGKTPVNYNRTAKAVNAVSGINYERVTELRALPRGVEDTKNSDMVDAAMKFSRDLADVREEDNEVFLDLCICGLGFSEQRMDYVDDPAGMWRYDRTDPFEMIYDPAAKKRNLSDIRWIARKIKLSKDEIEEMFPGNEVFQFMGNENDEVMSATIETRGDAYDINCVLEEKTQTDKNYVVYQYQWYDHEKYNTVKVGDNVSEISTAELTKYRAQATQVGATLEDLGIDVVERKRKKYHQCFYSNGKIVNKKDVSKDFKSPIDGFTFKAVTGYRDRANNSWYGLIRVMSEAQKWANKLMTELLFIINSNGKGGVMAEVGAFKSIAQAQRDYSKPNSFILLNPGGKDKIVSRDPAPFPASIDRLLQYSLEAINDTVGINLEMLGNVNRNQPAYVEYQRKEQSITIMASLFAGMKLFRKENGRALLKFIRKYMTDGRMLRLSNSATPETIQLMKIPDTYVFDIVVNESPYSKTQKDRVFSTLLELFPALQASGVQMPIETFDYLPLPETLINKIKEKNSGQESPEQAQIKQQMQQMAMATEQEKVMAMQLENRKRMNEIQAHDYNVANKVTDSALNIAKAKHEEAIAQDELAQAAQKMGGSIRQEGQKIALEDERFIREQQRKDIGMILEQERMRMKDLSNITNRGGEDG